jgi:broad specificity phosphatase PhoE
VVTIVFETHSITEDNEAGIATGWLPGTLSAEGRRLAKELGRRRAHDVDAVVTSDLGRAVETADIAFAHSEVPRRTDSRLRECNYGDLNGQPVEMFAGQRKNHVERPYPNGESWSDAVARLDSFLADAARQYRGQRVLVIAHSAQRFGLAHLIDGTPLEDLVDADFGWQEGWEYTVG